MNDFVSTLLQAVIIAAVPVMTVFIGKGLGALATYFSGKTENETVQKYLQEVADAIKTAVAYTGQTYVDALKTSETFTKENQEAALQKAMDKAMSLLNADATKFLTETYGDLKEYLEAKIEQEVKAQKVFTATAIEATAVLSDVPDLTAAATAENGTK